jgi:hypothetical protein
MTRTALLTVLAALALAYVAIGSPFDSDDKSARCNLAPVTPPNYNPLDDVPDNPLPSTGELLPPASQCPEIYQRRPNPGMAPPVPGFDPGGAPSLPDPKLPGPTPYPPQQPNPDPYGPYS